MLRAPAYWVYRLAFRVAGFFFMVIGKDNEKKDTNKHSVVVDTSSTKYFGLKY